MTRMQPRGFVEVPFPPLGEFTQPTVRSRSLVDTLTGLPLFWNVRRA